MTNQIKPMLAGAALVLAGVGAGQLFGAAVPAAQAQPAGAGWCKVMQVQSLIQLEQDLGQHYGRGATIVTFFIDNQSMKNLPYVALVCGR